METHSLFPEKCNVTLAKVKNKNLIEARVWDRGVGITKACGTAACATAVAAFRKKLSKNILNIQFELGEITVTIENNNFIHMKGKVSEIKEIEINI